LIDLARRTDVCDKGRRGRRRRRREANLHELPKVAVAARRRWRAETAARGWTACWCAPFRLYSSLLLVRPVCSEAWRTRMIRWRQSLCTIYRPLDLGYSRARREHRGRQMRASFS
jgi:hypothetical protein